MTAGDRQPARLCRRTSARARSCALTPDPLVLFPGADIATATDLSSHEGACAVLVDSASLHDPQGADRSFARFHGSLTVRDASGRCACATGAGSRARGSAHPRSLGTCRAWATLLALGPLDRLPDAALLESRCGSGRLPVRCGRGTERPGSRRPPCGS